MNSGLTQMFEAMDVIAPRNPLDQRLRLRSWIAGVACLVLATFSVPRVQGVETPWVMYQDPLLKTAPVKTVFPRELVDRWVQALARPEREMKRQAALAIAEAVGRGVPGLDVTIDPLCDVLREPGQDRMVRLSAARALVTLDAQRGAPVLIEATSPKDLEMAEIVEPALARWGDEGLRERWIERMNGELGLRRFHVLAIRGLAALREKEAVPRLREFAMSPYIPVDVRLEAATALGTIETTGLLEPARKLCEDEGVSGMVDRLVAVRMVVGHRGEDAESFLLKLAVDSQPSVRTIALGHLFGIDASLILAVINETVMSEDANVRRWGAEALIARPSVSLFKILVPMLDDRDPEIRRYICDSLVTLAETPDFREVILEQARNVLAADGWRGQEQAILLLVSLKDTTIVDRLVELLDASRREVNVTAAWGLCELAVPTTAEPVHKALQRKTESWLAAAPQNDGIGDELALLAQLLGVLKYAPADPVLRKYIRKGTALDSTSRSAAIWALGKINSGEPDEKLAKLLEGRVRDAFSMVPEDPVVCRMSAVSLARIQAVSAVETLRSSFEQLDMQSGFGYACAWAIWQLTGDEIPPLNTMIDYEHDWFLVPAAEQ